MLPADLSLEASRVLTNTQLMRSRSVQLWTRNFADRDRIEFIQIAKDPLSKIMHNISFDTYY